MTAATPTETSKAHAAKLAADAAAAARAEQGQGKLCVVWDGQTGRFVDTAWLRRAKKAEKSGE